MHIFFMGNDKETKEINQKVTTNIWISLLNSTFHCVGNWMGRAYLPRSCGETGCWVRKVTTRPIQHMTRVQEEFYFTARAQDHSLSIHHSRPFDRRHPCIDFDRHRWFMLSFFAVSTVLTAINRNTTSVYLHLEILFHEHI